MHWWLHLNSWVWVQVVHFVRHGEGFHNIGIVNEDAHLTEAGWRQAEALNKHIQQLRPHIDVQVCRNTLGPIKISDIQSTI